MKTYVIMVAQHYPQGHIHQGQPTFFASAILEGEKIHTIRTNYLLWSQRILEVQRGIACLELRQWTDKPYKSKQRLIKRLTAADGVGIQALFKYDYGFYVDKYNVNTATLAANDGLTVDALHSWFRNAPKAEAMALIHFTSFRYGHPSRVPQATTAKSNA